MPHTLKTTHFLNPITALAAAEVASTLVLLAAEGCHIRFYDSESSESIGLVRVFQEQTIHGIQCQFIEEELRTKCLVWGGKSIAIIDLTLTACNLPSIEVHCQFMTKELFSSDWISDALLFTGMSPRDQNVLPAAVFLTSHNALYSLILDSDSSTEHLHHPVIVLCIFGPPSVLYSGHIVNLDNGQVLVAAGTVFGNVLLWTCDIYLASAGKKYAGTGRVLYCFSGHEGSVFGVRISDAAVNPGPRQPLRIVASCSDDRTIRIWDISNVPDKLSNMSRDVTYIQAAQTGFKSQSSQNTLDCLAVTIGHSSRIWGLRFISSSENEWSLMSFGEDSTCQTWRLVPKVSSSGSREEDELHTHSLIPLQTYKYHTGKNLWGAKVFNSINAKCVVSTGGADGRVVLYQIPCSGSQSNAIQVYSWTSESSLVDLTTTTRADPPCLNTEHRPQHSPSQGGQAFTSLIGCWELHRLLESALPAYPSGVFKGIAVMTTRCPTDPAYDAEYLYEESGTLTTQQGLLLKGSRKYVYRYQKDLDAITAWFVKPDANITVDYLFHNFSFEATDKGYPGNPTSTAKGHHLCVEDEYDVYYTFNYEREILKNWTLRYDVKGPYKNYVAKATYIRTSGDQHSNVSVTKAIDMAEGHELLTGTNTKYGSLKTYCWTGFHNLISTTANGYVVIASLESGNKNDSLPNPSPTVLSCSQQIPWVLLGYIPDLESFSVVVSIANDIVLFGSATGRIYMYQNFTRSINPLSKVPGKVSSIYGISIYRSSGDIAVAAIVSCLGDPFSYYVSVDANGHVSGDTPNRIPLELPSSFVVTSACFVELEQLIILGSRGGALSFYDHNMTLSTSLRTSCCCIRKIHGEDAVTVIKVVPCKDPDLPGLYLLTAGRDGRFAVHLLSVERENGMICIKFETVHVAEPLSGSNIEGANFDSINGDILIWGFHSTEFVVYNETKQKDVVKIPCGGSHRSWAYRPNLNGTGGGRFVWTKASTCNVLVQLEASHLVLNPGGHGREIKAMSFCPVTCQLKGRISRLVATGAEDTIIRITGYHCEAGIFGEKFQNLGIIHDHKTGIQQLQWSPDGKYLFSAGGREEFYIWRIRSVPGIGVGFVRVAQGPPITESSELRVMDFDITTMNQNISDPPRLSYLISIVYSDSTLRIFLFNPAKSEEGLMLVSASTYTTCCLMQIQYLHIGPSLITAGTDGSIVFWPLDEVIQEFGVSIKGRLQYDTTLNTIDRISNLLWGTRHCVHQSSIKCMAVTYISVDAIVVVTGGDDNALAFTHVTNASQKPGIAPICSTLLLPRAHSSTITGVQCLNPPHCSPRDVSKHSIRYATISNDQRLKTWTLEMSLDFTGAWSISVKKGANVYSSIADASCLEVSSSMNAGEKAIHIGGIGTESWLFEAGDTEELVQHGN